MKYSRRQVTALPFLLAALDKRGLAQAPAPKPGDDFMNPIPITLTAGKASHKGIGDANLRHNIVYKLSLDDGAMLTATLSDLPARFSATGAMAIRLVKGDAKDFVNAIVLDSHLTESKNPKTPSVAKLEYAVAIKADYFIVLEFLAGGLPYQLDLEVKKLI